MKLISLKEKPATKKDKGKTIYQIKNLKIKEFKIIKINVFIDHVLDVEDEKGQTYCCGRESPKMFWQKPRIISEDEYQYLKNIEGKIHTDCEFCPLFNKGEVLNTASNLAGGNPHG